MAKTGSERVEAHRQRRKAEVETRAEVEALRAELANAQASSIACPDCFKNIAALFEIAEKNDNLIRANKAVNTKYKNSMYWKGFELIGYLEDAGIDLVKEYLEDNGIDVSNRPLHLDWTYLIGLDDTDLRNWAKLGHKVSQQEDSDGVDTVHTATEWIRGNTPKAELEAGP